MVYVPRGVDNSTGGFVVNPDPRFGPLANTLIGLSFGNSQLYAILRNHQDPERTQGAVVPLPGMTASGICRAAVSPIDGQLYVVGINGWGDYAIADGCLHRYRYTGQPYRRPTDFAIEPNGIRVVFAESLDRAVAESAGNYFAQKWQYEYSMGYGSHEFSIEQPDSLGHDRVAIASVRLEPSGKSIFVEIPDLKPAMVQHLRMHLRTAAGTDFKTDLFTTIAKDLKLPINADVGRFHNPETIGDVLVDKTYQLDAIPGLAYSTATITVPAGKTIGIRFTNTDQMPHNLVIVAPGTYEAVGLASEKMLALPDAANKNYVPDSAKVIAQTPMILPDTEYDLVFKTPSAPGRYPYLCTFPGHWRLMKGELIVEPAK
jgi:azurin